MSNTTACIRMDGKPGVNVDGIGAEILSLNRLKWLDQKIANDAELREHPHKYFEIHREIWWPHVPPLMNYQSSPNIDIRLDVNTQADYDFIASIYNHFCHNHFTAQEILACPPVQERLHGR